jgi:hypothetical protein
LYSEGGHFECWLGCCLFWRSRPEEERRLALLRGPQETELCHKEQLFTLPLIDDPLDTLAEAKWFSTLYLYSGYWQMDLHPDDKEKTTFSTGEGLWHFTVMRFGPCNAPTTFELLMVTVLRGFSYESCLVCLDVIMVSRTF